MSAVARIPPLLSPAGPAREAGGATSADDPAAPPARAVTRAAETPLLPLVAAREPGAVQACLDRYGPAIWNLARRLCRSRDDAEDATQDVFVELWRHAGRYDAAAGGEWTFVLTIARRRLIDRLRRAGRRQDVAVGRADDAAGDSPGERAAADPEQSPPERAGRAEQARLAVAAMAQLSADQRRVLHLSTFEGLSYPEVAEQLGMPLGTVKTHARRGLIRLRTLLNVEVSTP